MEQDYNLKKWSKGCPNTGISCRRSSCGIEYVFIPAALGDDQKGSPVAPKNGSYNNAIVYYEATGNVYLYSSDGVPTRVEENLDSIIAELQKELDNVEEALSEETTAREAADAALGSRIDTVADDLAAETTARENSDTALQNNITAEATARANADTALGNRVTAIEEKIPTQASAQNQLADKNFVNSSVATNTANYISNNGQPFNSLAELEAYSGTLTNNDYAFVVGTDQAGNTTYTRYKYVADTDSWAEEYVLNNSSFTAAQWAAINSGITSGDVSKLNSLANIQTIGANLILANGELSVDTSTVATQADLAAGLAGKQDTLTAGANITIDANNVISATGGGSGGVSDVQIDGTSIVNAGIANINYASTATGGVIRVNPSYGLNVAGTGTLIGVPKSYSSYDSGSDLVVITKGTLENVITGKGLVSNTDYATTSIGGVTKVNATRGTAMTNAGTMQATIMDYQEYQNAHNQAFIGKGTLENVITGKGLVSNTDYATSNTGGVIKVNSTYATQVSAAGIMRGVTKSYSVYDTGVDDMFICKGTLENVIDGKGLVDQTDLATKQDVLTAGTGISITNGVISCTFANGNGVSY